MKKFILLLATLALLPPAFSQSLSEYQKMRIAQQVKQVLKDYESAFCVYTNPAVVNTDERTQAQNRLWANVRDDARFENDLVPGNQGSKTIDFNEYQGVAFVNYRNGRGLNYSLDWEEAEVQSIPEGLMVLFYGYKTLIGSYQGRRPLRLEGEPCRVGVYVTMQGDMVQEAKIGIMDSDVSRKNGTFPLTNTTNPLAFFTLADGIQAVSRTLASQLPAGVVKKVSIETLTYEGKNVVNDFSHEVTGYLKTSLSQRAPGMEVAVIAKSRSFEPVMTLRGSYEKVGNFLKIATQFYDSQDRPVGRAAQSEVPWINIRNAEVVPPTEQMEVAATIREVTAPTPVTQPASGSPAALRFEMTTNKGDGPQSFSEKDTMTVKVRANKACVVRLVYRDAENNIVLLRSQDFAISDYQVDRWVELPDTFVCSPPYFGIELLWGFATTGFFSALHTRKEGGFTFIKDDLKTIKTASSDPKSMKNIGVSVAEKSIQITTSRK